MAPAEILVSLQSSCYVMALEFHFMISLMRMPSKKLSWRTWNKEGLTAYTYWEHEWFSLSSLLPPLLLLFLQPPIAIFQIAGNTPCPLRIPSSKCIPQAAGVNPFPLKKIQKSPEIRWFRGICPGAGYGNRITGRASLWVKCDLNSSIYAILYHYFRTVQIIFSVWYHCVRGILRGSSKAIRG